jgi:hypothetical protein
MSTAVSEIPASQGCHDIFLPVGQRLRLSASRMRLWRGSEESIFPIIGGHDQSRPGANAAVLVEGRWYPRFNTLLELTRIFPPTPRIFLSSPEDPPILPTANILLLYFLPFSPRYPRATR